MRRRRLFRPSGNRCERPWRRSRDAKRESVFCRPRVNADAMAAGTNVRTLQLCVMTALRITNGIVLFLDEPVTTVALAS